MHLDPVVIVIWSISILVAALSTIILIGSRKLSSTLFSIAILVVSVWIASVGVLIMCKDSQFALYNIRLNYYLGSLIANTFYLFFTTFPDKRTISRKLLFIFVSVQFIFLYLYIFTDLIISKILFSELISGWVWEFGKLSMIFEVTFISFFLFGLIKLHNNYANSKHVYTRKNIIFMLMTVISGLLPSAILCILLPRLGVFSLNWLGPITEIIWVPVIMYSIIKYRQMNIKHLLSITLATSLVAAFLINTFIDLKEFYYIKLVIILLYIFLSYYLIKMILNDHKKSVKIFKENISLSRIVSLQTTEVRRAYAIENKARKDLEKLNETKDQFIMMTQHNLRAPITTIKSELEQIISGDGGKVDNTALETIIRTRSSTDRLSQIVDDFLSITAIKVDSQILKLVEGNIKTLIDSIIHDLRFEIETMEINIKYLNDEIWPNIKMDINKIKEALTIIIENAVKYNFDRGIINISNRIIDNNLVLAVENTGVGITEEEKNNIFSKLFYRSRRAQERNPIGMGIGLQVAKAIITGHKGRIDIDSFGENYGAKVEITLPINPYYEV